MRTTLKKPVKVPNKIVGKFMIPNTDFSHIMYLFFMVAVYHLEIAVCAFRLTLFMVEVY